MLDAIHLSVSLLRWPHDFLNEWFEKMSAGYRFKLFLDERQVRVPMFKACLSLIEVLPSQEKTGSSSQGLDRSCESQTIHQNGFSGDEEAVSRLSVSFH